MRTLFVCSFSLVAFAVPVAADAQEASRNWTGFYAGLHAGAGSSDVSNTPVTVSSDSPTIPLSNLFVPLGASLDDEDGFIGGGQIGSNFRINGLVLGIEGDLSSFAVDSSSSETRPTRLGDPFTTTLEQEIDWLATIRGRIGFVPIDSLLLYGTAGVAFADVDASLTYANDSTAIIGAAGGPSFVRCAAKSVCFTGSDAETTTGWTAGGGFEFALSDTVSLKGEYLFVDLGSHSVRATGTDPSTTPDNSLNTEVDTELHVVNLGLNFHFD